MSTSAQIEANRENAKHSTGPVTAEGKAASSQNNFRHGLRGAFVVLPHESQAQFEALHDALAAEYQPVLFIEHMLVDEMVEHEWRSRRTAKMVDHLLNEAIDPDPKILAMWLRYQTYFNRAFHKCIADLLRLKAERRRDQIGFERQKLAAAAEARKLQVAEARNRAMDSKTAARELATASKAARQAAILQKQTPDLAPATQSAYQATPSSSRQS